MELMNLNSNETITTIELREIVNQARILAGENPVENRHFVSRIEDELEGEISNVKIFRPERGGMPQNYYVITLEQAMLVGMRESKAVRRAVLVKLKELQARISQPVYTPLQDRTEMEKAVGDLEAWKKMSEMFSVPVSIALVEGTKYVDRTYDVNVKPLLQASPLMSNIQDSEVMLEPTELGKKFGISAIALNKMLEQAGLQVRKDSAWEPTEKTSGYVVRHFWSANNGSKSGYNLKWNVEFVKRQLGK